MADGNKWDNLLSDMSSGGGGPFFYPKAGRMQFRIVPIDAEKGKDAEEWFRSVESFYQGRRKEKFLVRGIVLQSDQGELSERFQDKIVPIVLSKSAFRGVIQILADDEFPLLDLENGHGVTHNRQGEGKMTSYTVSPSRKEIPIDMDDYEIPDEDMNDWAVVYAESQDRSEAVTDEDTGW